MQKTLKLLMTAVFMLLNSTTHAKSFKSESDLMSSVKKDLAKASTAEEFIDGQTHLSAETKSEMNAWAKKNKVTKMPAMSLHGSTIVFQLEDAKASLTVTDFKNKKLHLNNKLLTVPGDLSVADYFDFISKQLTNSKAENAWFHLIDKAYADTSSNRAAVALSAGSTAATAAGCLTIRFCGDASDLIEAVQSSNKKLISLSCTHAGSSDSGATLTFREQELENYTPPTRDTGLNYYYMQTEMEYSYEDAVTGSNPRVFEWPYRDAAADGRPPFVYIGQTPTQTPIDQVAAADKQLMTKARQCCGSQNCITRFDQLLQDRENASIRSNHNIVSRPPPPAAAPSTQRRSSGRR